MTQNSDWEARVLADLRAYDLKRFILRYRRCKFFHFKEERNKIDPSSVKSALFLRKFLRGQWALFLQLHNGKSTIVTSDQASDMLRELSYIEAKERRKIFANHRE